MAGSRHAQSHLTHARTPAGTTSSSAPRERACYTGAAWLRRVGGLWPAVPGRLAPGPAAPGILSTRTEVTVMRTPLSELPEAFPAASPARGSPRTRGSFGSGALGRGRRSAEGDRPPCTPLCRPARSTCASSRPQRSHLLDHRCTRPTHTRAPWSMYEGGPPVAHTGGRPAPQPWSGLLTLPAPLCQACGEWGSRPGSGVSPGGTHIRCSHSPGPPGWFSEDPRAGGPSLEQSDPLESSGPRARGLSTQASASTADPHGPTAHGPAVGAKWLPCGWPVRSRRRVPALAAGRGCWAPPGSPPHAPVRGALLHGLQAGPPPRRPVLWAVLGAGARAWVGASALLGKAAPPPPPTAHLRVPPQPAWLLGRGAALGTGLPPCCVPGGSLPASAAKQGM